MYHVTTDEESDEQIAALPSAALPALAEARVLLEVDPWAGDPDSRHNPEAPLRGLAFGAAGLCRVATWGASAGRRSPGGPRRRTLRRAGKAGSASRS